MSQCIEHPGKAEETKAILQPGPSSWTEALVGMLPCLIFGLVMTLVEMEYLPWFASYVACYGVLLIGFVMGWVMGFPRWSYPYGGLILVLTWWWMGIPAQNLWRHNIRFLKEYNQLLEWWAWLPFGLAVAVALLITRSLRPLSQLITGVRRDWTRLSFGLYGTMPWLIWVAFDENRDPYVPAYLVTAMVALAGGALAYMRSGRALALLLGMSLSMAAQTVSNALYWNGRWEPWMRSEPDRWYEIVGRNIVAGAVLAALVFAPALLRRLRRSASRSVRTA